LIAEAICIPGSHLSASMGDGLTGAEARQWLADEAAGLSPRECIWHVWTGRCPSWPYRLWNQPGAVWMEPDGLNIHPAERRGGHWQPHPQGPLLPVWMASDVARWPIAA